ncbi:hypothetical protein ES705_29148 [subsurface metagenome]
MDLVGLAIKLGVMGVPMLVGVVIFLLKTRG